MASDLSANARLRGGQAAGVLLIVSGSAWLYMTMHLRLAASALGPICGHSGPFVLHCPACYAAAAMIAAGFAIAVGAARRSPVLRAQRISSRR